MTEETKIIYYKDTDQDKVPYMIKLSIAPDKATLRDFKQALNVNVRQFKFFFQQIVEDFGTVKEEICDDNMKLPFVNGRAICWLHQVEGSLISSDSRSQNSLNLQPTNTEMNNGGEMHNNYQFTSMQSVSSQGSSKSNNENMGVIQRNRNNNNKHDSNGQIYDTLNNRKSKIRQSAPLKDLNADDTSTDTESLISGFDDFRIQHQRPASMMIGGLGNGGSGSMRMSNKTGQFNGNQVGIKGQNNTQKRSLDSQYMMHNQLRTGGVVQTQSVVMQNRHSTNGNFYSNYNQQQVSYKSRPSRNNEFDSYSENSDDETTNIEFDETADDSQNSSQARTATTAPSIISSNLDTTTFFDTENDDDDGQFSSITDNSNSTLASSRYPPPNRNRRKLRHKLPSHHHQHNRNNHTSLHSSMSSLADSTMSLNIITITLKMDSVNFLGISIVGQSNKGGEGGIYVGSIMSGGAVAQDGRIEPGDMILQVNETSFENMSNDDAVRVLREAVMKPGPVKLVVAKCWDPNPQGYFTVSKQEPIRPIDPSAWVAHTQAHTGTYPANNNNNNAANYHQIAKQTTNYRLSNSVSTFGSNSSLNSSLADSTISNAFNPVNNYYRGNGVTPVTTQGDSTRFGNEHLNLTIKTDMETLVRAMAASDSGLDVRDRNWLKITIPNAFIGSDVVDWLFNHVEGFPDRRDARKYACDMLRFGFIRHAVNKVRFSEQSYYIFGDFAAANGTLMTMNGGQGGQGNLFTLNEESEVDFDSVSELDRDAIYAPMNYQGNYQMQNGHHTQQANYGHLPRDGNYGHIPKLYSNLNGIGGPPPPPSYMSSSSSNATSNSTSTTSNNTTTHTIATTTSTTHTHYNNSHTNNTNTNNSSSGLGNSSNGSAVSSALINQQSAACQFYYPTPSQQLYNQDNSQMSQLSAFNHKNMNSLNTDTDIDDTFQTNTKAANTLLTTPISIHSNHRYNLAKSVRSSDGGSSGNGSDVELLSSKKSKGRSNYYEESTVSSNRTESKSRLKHQRSLDQVPKEIRTSKQSFTQAMEKPCEFFVDVM